MNLYRIGMLLSPHIRNCPFCGSDAGFTHKGALGFYIQCTDNECGGKGKTVSLPSYWGKSKQRLASRLFMRALKSWNKRV